jgi:hypothetical protein
MAELGIPYALQGPDGTRAVIGAGDVARADPDWIGYPDPEAPIAIVRSIRGGNDDRVEGDGAVANPRYHGGAQITMKGMIDPNASITRRHQLEQKLRRATRALRTDGLLRYQPSGYPERAWWYRRTSDPDVSGRQPWQFGIVLDCANAYALSPAENSQLVVPGVAGGEIGVISPVVSPVVSAIAQTGQANITNAGDVDTWPRFRINGPIVNPRVLNNTTGLQVAFTYTLAAGEFLDYFPSLGRVLLGGVTDRYVAYDRPNSTPWTLPPGVSDVRLLSTSYSVGANLTIYWRDAWE